MRIWRISTFTFEFFTTDELSKAFWRLTVTVLKANLSTNEEQIEVFPYFEGTESVFKSLGLGYTHKKHVLHLYGHMIGLVIRISFNSSNIEQLWRTMRKWSKYSEERFIISCMTASTGFGPWIRTVDPSENIYRSMTR